MTDLSPLWRRFLDSVHPDSVEAAERLKEVPALAEKHCGFSGVRLERVEKYVSRIQSDPELLANWISVREVVLRTSWDSLLEEAFPACFRKDMPEQAFLLTVALSGIPDAENNFLRLGLGTDKLHESFDEFGSWTENCEKNYGLTGLEFDHGFAWIVLRLFTGDVLRFGRLEYNRCLSFGDILAFRNRKTRELRVLANGSYRVNSQGFPAVADEKTQFRADTVFGIFGTYYGHPVTGDGRIHSETLCVDPAEWECVLRPWDPVLYMHIPELGPLTPDGVRQSYHAVEEFYSRPDSGYHPKAIVCASWLFDPVLQELLPESANLCQFQKSGFLLPARGEESDAVRRVFGVKAQREGIQAVEWKTGLQKALGKYLSDGGHCRGGRFLYLF